MVAPITISHLSAAARLAALRSIAVVEATDNRNFWIVVLGRNPEGFAFVSGLTFEAFVKGIARQLAKPAWASFIERKYSFRANGSLVF